MLNTIRISVVSGCRCNTTRVAQIVDLKFSEYVHWDVELNYRTPRASWSAKWYVYNDLGIFKDIKFKLSEKVEWYVEANKKSNYMHPGCQKGVFIIFQEWLMVYT